MNDDRYFSLDETKQYFSIIERLAELRSSFKVRKRHYDHDLQHGFTALANSRLDDLKEIKAEIERLQPQAKKIAQLTAEYLAADAKDKRVRLLNLTCEKLVAAPADLAKLEQKISALYRQVFDAPRTRTRSSIGESITDVPFDDVDAESYAELSLETPAPTDAPAETAAPAAAEPTTAQADNEGHAPKQLSLFD